MVGYKQTDVGLIPNDWEFASIGKLAHIETGTTPPTIDRSNYGNDFLFVSPADLGENKWIEKAEKKLSKKGFSISRNFPKDSILFTCIGSTIGKAGIAKFELTSNQQINAILPNDNYSSEFVYYVLQLIRKKIKEQAGEQAVPMINKSSFSEFKIPLPPLPEQEAIAEVLSDTDAVIGALEKRIAKKRLIKQGAMQTLLTPKDDWEVKKLGEIADITSAGVDKKIKPNETPVTLINYMDVYNRDYIYRNELSHIVTAPFAKTINCNVKKGDIFLLPSSETRTDIGTCAISMENMDDAVYSYHILRLRYLIEIDELFGMFMLKTQSFLNQSETLCEGSGKRYVVSMNKFRSMEVFYPKLKDEQTRIATILSDMDNEIDALEKKLSKTKELKQGLMQQLLTGKIRLV